MTDQSTDRAAQAYRQGMRRLAAGVSLITTQFDRRRHGMAATAVTSVTTEPPTLLVCVNRQASIHAPLLAAGRFGVNVLSGEHDMLPPVFASPEKRVTRFDHGEWYERDGLPLLRNAEASFICDVVEHRTVGTHSVILGHVREVPELRATSRPLIWHEGAIRILETEA